MDYDEFVVHEAERSKFLLKTYQSVKLDRDGVAVTNFSRHTEGNIEEIPLFCLLYSMPPFLHVSLK